jgi:SNF2 family DNA or RNA helicase
MTETLAGSDKSMALPVPSGLKLFPHQEEGVAFALARLRTNRGVMFGDVMGLGKTIEAIITANAMGPSRILVVCPASALITWRREIWKWQTLGLIPTADNSGCSAAARDATQLFMHGETP